MLVAISDIHLQDTTLSGAPDDENVPAQAFELFFQHVAASARHTRAREIIFLLNGDILDFLRSERWFDDGFQGRPYWTPITPAVEAKLLTIWDGIEQSNRAVLRLLEAVAHGRDPFDFPVQPRFVYVAGNHDRVANLSPVLRRKVRTLLNLNHTDAPLDWTFAAPEYGVFARHGHEYDWANSEYNFTRATEPLTDDLYWRTPLGDWVTLDLATYLPHRFRQLYADHPLFEHIYHRLRSIDDVRPVTAAVPWLRAEVADSREAYHILANTIGTVCREKLGHPFVWSWLKAHGRSFGLDRTHLWRVAVRVVPKLVRKAPARIVWWIARHLLSGTGITNAWEQAARERVFDDPDYQYVVSGHFHVPRTVLLRKTDGRPYVYFCIGSWRNRFEECALDGRFLRLRAMSYLTFFRDDEDPDHLGRPKSTSFSLWGGVGMHSLETDQGHVSLDI